MKQLIIVLFMFLVTFDTNAICSRNYFSVFPFRHEIKQNSIFVVDGYMFSQEIIKALNIKYPIYLKSGNEIINLVVKEVLVGQYSMTQALLQPEHKLLVGHEYSLVIGNLPKEERYNVKFDTISNVHILKTYTVIQGIDIDAPIFLSKPIEIAKTKYLFSCDGESIYVVFNCPIIDSSEFLIRATVKNIKTGIESSNYILPYDGHIKIGHNDCGGAFKFEERESNYEIEFSALDASGNFTKWIGKKIEFTSPTNDNAEPCNDY